MPMFYGVSLDALQTTNATPLTENDALFVKPGTTRAVWLRQMLIHGRGASLTALSQITARLKKWTTTSSAGGTAITPSPKDPGYQAAKATAAAAVGAVTSGTGGPTRLGVAFGCGATGPGGWQAPDLDGAPTLEGAATQSLDVFVSSATASLNYELAGEIAE